LVLNLIAYIDYVGWRRLILSAEELDLVLLREPRASISLIVMIGGDYPISEETPYLSAWLSLSTNVNFIESTRSLVMRRARGLLSSRDAAVELVRILSSYEYGIADIVLLDNYMRLTLNEGIRDLGILVLYENPRSVIMGIREPDDLVPNRLITRELHVEFTSRCSIIRRSLRVHVCRQYDSSVELVDWSNPGLIPYTKFHFSVTNGVETADPVFSSLVRFRVKVRSTPSSRSLVLATRWAMDSGDHCEGSLVSLPYTLTRADYVKLVERLRDLGFSIVESGSRVDELIARCMDRVKVS